MPTKKKSTDLAVAASAAPADLSTALAPVARFSPREFDAKREILATLDDVAKAVQVTDAASLERANALLVAAVQEKDAIEGMRKSVTGPLHQIKRTIDGWFKPLVVVLERAESNLKAEIGRYTAAQRQLQAASYQAAGEAHRAGDHEQARAALVVASTADTATPQGLNVREEWTAEVIAADLLPREYLMPDEAKIKAHARQTSTAETPFPIPGVRFTKRQIVAVRR